MVGRRGKRERERKRGKGEGKGDGGRERKAQGNEKGEEENVVEREKGERQKKMKSGRRKQRRGKKMRECERRGRGGRKEWEKGGRKEKRERGGMEVERSCWKKSKLKLKPLRRLQTIALLLSMFWLSCESYYISQERLSVNFASVQRFFFSPDRLLPEQFCGMFWLIFSCF